MKRRRKQNSKKLRKNSRKRKQTSPSLAYDPLEKRQLLAFDTGISLLGAALGEPDITSIAPNPEGDVGPDHFAEIGEQTFTVYDRNGIIVESTSLNQFFLDAGANLQGDTLQSPRIIYDRLTERWFAIAVGSGEGDFAGNRIHIAFSDTSDPSGQWQQLDFVADVTGVKVHDNPTLGVDADGIYFATQNFNNGNLEDVAIYALPKADVLKANPSLTNLAAFTELSVFEYGVSIQFASSFDASDGTVFGFSTQTQDVSGSGNPDQAELNPSNINSFEITNPGLGNDGAALTTPSLINVGGPGNIYVAPRAIEQFTADQTSTVEIEIEGGLTQSLVEQDGSVFVAQTVGILFVEGGADDRRNSINWFQVNVTPGAVPEVPVSPIHGPVNRLFSGFGQNIGDFLPDPPEFDTDPALNTPEIVGVSYFNPAIAVSDSGIAAITFNSVSSFDLFGTGAPLPNFIQPGIATEISLGIPVNGVQSADGSFPRQFIQFENPTVLQPSFATDAFTPAGGSQWGAYASLRTDPNNPNNFFSVSPFQEENNDEWAVALNEILPLDFQPVVPSTPAGNEIIIRRAADDNSFIEVEIDGAVADRFSESLIRRLVVTGLDGADTFIVDYSNGDPAPSATLGGAEGLLLFGDGGTDSIQSLTGENVDFLIDDAVGNGGFITPLFFNNESSFGGNANGTFTLVGDGLDNDPVIFQDFEIVVGGSGDDTFDFQSPLEGNAEGGDGDDRFVFAGGADTDGSVNGGAGFNTLDLSQRNVPTEVELFSAGQNQGFNGRTVDGPIGQFSQILDQFRDISLLLGSEISNQDIFRPLSVFEATYTLTIPNVDRDLRNPSLTPGFESSSIVQAGAQTFFTNFETIFGSVLDDVFNVQSNDANALPALQLEGDAGDDTFNFSSDSPLNEGALQNINGLITVNGGLGANSLVFSDFARLGEEDWLVLGARLSGPIEVIYIAENEQGDEGTFDVTLQGSDGAARDRFLLQSFLTGNTLNVFGNGGDDEFVIQDLSQADVNLFGGEGDDEYIIEQVAGVDDRNVVITDSVGAEQDIALIAGTLLDETFIIDLDSFASDQFTFIGVEEFGFDGRGGDDEFYVRAISEDFPILLRGGDGNDVFFISSDAPTNLGNLADLNNNLTIEAGTGANQILISNESGSALDVEIFASQIDGLINGEFNYTAAGGFFELIDITGSNGEDDRFLISSFADGNTLMIDGRLGADEFIIGNAGAPGAIGGTVVVDGASDGDFYTVFLENLSVGNVTIDDSGFSGIDTLNAKGTSASDNIALTQTSVTLSGNTLSIDEFFESVVVEGLGGDDIITMTNSPSDSVTLSGNDGDDQIIVNGTVGATEVLIFTTDGDDLIEINESSLVTTITAFGGMGTDTFFVGANVLGDVILDGQIGQDIYTIELTDNLTRDVQILDSSGASDVVVVGTAANDVFQIDNSGVTSGGQTIGLSDLASLGVQGLGGSDTFNIVETMVDLILNGGSGADVFNISSDAPFLSGSTAAIQADIDIEGGTGNNQLRVTNVDGTSAGILIGDSVISGLTNDFLINYQSTDGQFARPDGTIGGIHLITSDSVGEFIDITGLSVGDTLLVESRGGDDFFSIANAVAGNVVLDGGEGADTYDYQFGGAAVREVNIIDTGTTGTDLLNLVGSEFDDQITLTSTGITDGANTLTFNLPVDSISIAGLGGMDTFTINGAPTANVSLQGNDSNDTFVINSTVGIDNIELFAGFGNDNFEFNGSSDSTRITALGSGGNDSFVVSDGAFGRLFLDGENGGDVYQITFAGAGARRIVTVDSGVSGFDETQVFGTSQDDRIAMRTQLFLYDDEVVVFNENTERVQAFGLEGNDRLVVFGTRSPDAQLFGGTGDDAFVVNGGSAATQIDLSGQDGDDTFLVRRTTIDTVTNLFGQNGNDRFNIGSTPNQDDGSLGLIRGELNVSGGSNIIGEEDILYANDRGVNAAYSYSITPQAITPIAGPANLPRTNFVGINYNSSIEAVRLDGTDLANTFQVFASQATRYFIDGNNPTTNNADQLQVFTAPGDGSNLVLTNAAAGNGFVNFTNGNELVQFSEIENASLVNGGAVASAVETIDLDRFFSRTADDEWDA